MILGRIACDPPNPALAAALAARGLLAAAPLAAGADALVLRSGAAPHPLVAQVRRTGWAGPLMLLVERADDVIAALDAGADEAVCADAAPAEIAARLAARLRAPAGRIRIGALELDPVARAARRDDRPLRLRAREYALLAYLARQAGRAVPRAELLREVWRLGFDPGTNVVQVHVARLRAALDPPGATPMLHTDRGLGYRLSAA
ncbi:DNA-binding response regulator [Sphingomonas spermidinifaciens]|uniref:DNA-binding response regulator n=1 Tax=Sphingomonas spermidinifaciens TaxID=1141889 RepID=A0A2A4B8I5_9SPHN|nr:response regulator transcription factor [Sphingomonas spermidinifaciens]PCD04235.1 DNA-binding response regulator [Sphingomonas spermidinifaciens]